MTSPVESAPVQCAAILAGGMSRRMGQDKALLKWQGAPLISHVAAVLKPIFSQICVVTARPEVARAADLPAIPDRFDGSGPLGGIHAALSYFRAPTLVVACDMPYLNGDLIRFMARQFAGDALVARGENGHEPLHAIYSHECAPLFASFLRSEGKIPSLRHILGEIDTRFVSVEVARQFDADLRCFVNWNAPEDVEKSTAWHET